MWAAIKKILSKVYYYPYLPRLKAEANQNYIRHTEWESVSEFINLNTTFLDVGCGAGFNMQLAAKERKCEVWGVDPEPGQYGVGRYNENPLSDKIIKGYAEGIPFPDKMFDVVFSSHTLEHVEDTAKTLSEISRVMKDDGVLIIGMPTASMAFVLLLSELFFLFPARLANYISSLRKDLPKRSLKEAFFPSHSHSGKSVFFDLGYYRIENWRKTLSSQFQVHNRILPLMYPYPELRQFFKPFKSRHFSSSVFFICTKPGQDDLP